jgi:hypothetical protein
MVSWQQIIYMDRRKRQTIPWIRASLYKEPCRLFKDSREECDAVCRRVEYFHRSPASRRKRRKGNPVPGGITGPSCSWGIWIREPGPPGSRSLESERVKRDRESRWTRTWEWLRWRGPAAIANDIPIISSERVLRKDYNRNCWVGK